MYGSKAMLRLSVSGMQGRGNCKTLNEHAPIKDTQPGNLEKPEILVRFSTPIDQAGS